MNLRDKYEGKTVLVTGAAGFIGSHLVDALIDLNATVRGIDDLSEGCRENLTGAGERIDFVHGSILDAGGLVDLVDGCDVVFHLAANASVPRSSDDPAYDFQTNVVGTHRVMEACRAAGVDRLLYCSSAGVYGEPQRPLMDESHPLCPKSPYGGSKLAGEFLLAGYSRCYEFDQRIVRIFNTFGPRQRRYVMFDLLEKLRRDPRRLEVLGTGEQIRTYSYVADTVSALLLVAAHPDARGEIINIGGERQISIRELVDLVIVLLELPPPDIVYTMESWKGDIQRLCGDVTRLRSLGFRPTVGLEEGFRRLIAWHGREYPPES